jgi:hypothetical protein
MGQYSRAWSLIGHAVRAAVDLHLDRPMDLLSNSTKARSRSKHVFLGCFVLDTLVAARLKRRPHLRTDDIDAIGLVEEDGLEEWDPWTDCLTVRRGISGNSRVPASILSTFNRLIQVLKSLNDATCVPSWRPGVSHNLAPFLTYFRVTAINRQFYFPIKTTFTTSISLHWLHRICFHRAMNTKQWTWNHVPGQPNMWLGLSTNIRTILGS